MDAPNKKPNPAPTPHSIIFFAIMVAGTPYAFRIACILLGSRSYSVPSLPHLPLFRKKCVYEYSVVGA